MELRRSGRVLEWNLFFWVEVLCGCKGSQSCLMKSRQNEFFLARIDIDVADRINARDTGLEFLGIHANLFAIDIETPISDGS